MKYKALGLLVITLTASCRDSSKPEAQSEIQEPEAQEQNPEPKKDDPLLIPQFVTYSGSSGDGEDTEEPQDLIIKKTTTERSGSLVEKLNAVQTPRTVGMLAIIISNTLSDKKLAQAIVDAAGKREKGTIYFLIKSSDGSTSVEMTFADSKAIEIKASLIE